MLRKYSVYFFLVLPLFAVLSKSINAADQPLRFPAFAASFDRSVYDGAKGCLSLDHRDLAAIAANEGLKTIGSLKFLDTTSHGPHAFILMYHPTEDYGYILANKDQKSLCIAEKLTIFSFQEIGSYNATAIEIDGKYSPNQCKFTDRLGPLCATYTRLAAGLKNNGFALQFQGVKQNGDILSYFSSADKTYELTTDDKTGATVITGAGDEAFVFNSEKKEN